MIVALPTPHVSSSRTTMKTENTNTNLKPSKSVRPTTTKSVNRPLSTKSSTLEAKALKKLPLPTTTTTTTKKLPSISASKISSQKSNLHPSIAPKRRMNTTKEKTVQEQPVNSKQVMDDSNIMRSECTVTTINTQPELMTDDLISNNTQIQDADYNKRLLIEAQFELNYEKQVNKSMELEIQQLKNEIERLTLNAQQKDIVFEPEVFEPEMCFEEENKRLRCTLDQTQNNLADVLEKLSIKEKQYAAKEQEWMSKLKASEEENDRLQTLQRQTEHECLRLMDELLAIEKVDSTLSSDKLNEKLYRREIEHLKLQIERDSKYNEKLQRLNQEKITRLDKELYDLESMIENKIFRETELEQTIECERKKVQELEAKLRQEEEKRQQQQQNGSLTAPMSPTSPQPKHAHLSTFDLSAASQSNYCEICELHGHDVITCTAIEVHKPYENKNYCINCDIFGLHSTEECPNHDETF